MSRYRIGLGCFLVGGALCVARAAELLPPGFRPLPPGVHALVGGKAVVRPGESVDGATIVIRDGRIEAVGKNATVPPDARVWKAEGLTIYAGFIEPYWVQSTTNSPVSTSDVEPDARLTSPGVKFFGAAGSQTDSGLPGPGYEIAKITPERQAIRSYSPKEKELAPLRRLGFAAAVVAPAKGIVRGSSALVSLADEDPNRLVIKPQVFQHVAFETHQPGETAYPGSLMGVIAAIRKSFLDARFYAADHADYQAKPAGRRRPEYDPALEELARVIDRKLPVAFEPGSALMVDRAGRLGRELEIDYCIVSSGQEWRRPALAKAAGAVFIVPLRFPALPRLPAPEDWEQVSLDALRAWDWAPGNPAVLRREGIEIALSTFGLSDKKQFRPNLRLALDRGLSETDALAALTAVPARLCGVDKLLGAIEPGKLANLTVVEGGSYFDPESRVRDVWIDGRVYHNLPEPGKAENEEGTSGSKPVGEPGRETAQLKEEPEKKPKPAEVAAQAPSGQSEKPQPGAMAAGPNKEEDSGKEKQVRDLRRTRLARSPLEGRGPLAEPPAVLIEHATIWTCGPQGTLEDADLLVSKGKIKAVGKGLAARSDYQGPPLQIDGRGLHVTPGLIDAHSHTAILGAVNESSLPSTAMVRIEDVINSETDNLHQQLAGGVTAVNLFHGSANPIGGQSAVIKLRDGAPPQDLILESAPPGIKFALGENVKQSGWGDKFTTRFPQTRMGVRAFIANRFTAAKEYLEAWAKYRAGGTNAGIAPRRDLELEALGEVLQGKRWIHCHAYRQDEILMMMRLMESFGVKVASFEHVLEGYKIADELARHGAAGSTFADWWAYKFEVYDAIAYNGSLMHNRGVLVAFNSDSSELARRLYTEAAKAVKYGGTSEIDALRFVTLNPAKELRIDRWIGSLEPGKDADFAIWSKSPLNSATVCQQTWIEGKKYFDRALEGGRAGRLQQERDDLLARARKVAKLGGGGEDSGGGDADGDEFFRVSLEHAEDQDAFEIREK